MATSRLQIAQDWQRNRPARTGITGGAPVAYGIPGRPPGSGPLAPSSPAPSAPGAPGGAPVAPSSADPFGDYLRNNPGARDNWAYLEAILNDYGLGSLSGFVKENIIEGRSEVELEQRIRETTEYKTRFRAIEDRKKAGLPPVSADYIVNWEREATAVLRRMGFPEGFYDSPDDFADFIVRDWSVKELADEATFAETVAAQTMRDPANADLVAEMTSQYGMDVTKGAIMAWSIDSEKALPVLQRQKASVRLGAAARRAGYGGLTAQEGERLADLGISEDQAAEGYSELVRDRELFTPLNGGEDMISREEQSKATFGGNRFAQERIEKRRARRQAEFASGGGGFTAERSGVVGLGSARR